MREFETFDLREMPTPERRQINLPTFMVTQDIEDVNEEKITVKDIIRLIALAGIVWFFCYLDTNVMVGLIGLMLSTSALCIAGGGNNDRL